MVSKKRVFINKVKPVSTVSAPGIPCGCEPGEREGKVFVRTKTTAMGMGSGLGAGVTYRVFRAMANPVSTINKLHLRHY